jgi:hypothetical protein
MPFVMNLMLEDELNTLQCDDGVGAWSIGMAWVDGYGW